MTPQPQQNMNALLAALEQPPSLTPRAAAKILVRGMCLFDAVGVDEGGFQKDTIYWRSSRREWVTVRWVTVTDYNYGLFCFRNDVIPAIPKQVWPFELPPVRRFKLIMDASEIQEQLGAELFVFCSALGELDRVLSWPLFVGDETYPGYAWTRKARETYNINHKRV